MADTWLQQVDSDATYPVLVDRGYGAFQLSKTFRAACKAEGLEHAKLVTNRADSQLIALILRLGVSACEGPCSRFIIEQVPAGASYKFELRNGCETLIVYYDCTRWINDVLLDDKLDDHAKVALLQRIMPLEQLTITRP